MATADSRPPKVVLDSITTQAERVRQAAAELTKRIEHFQEWLGSVPGRVETDYFGPHPDAKTDEDGAFRSLVIRLHRDGKKWILSFAHFDERHTHEEWGAFSEFKPLADAPLKIKMAAVKHFPNILAAIEKSQVQLVNELNAATSEYDAFAAKLSIPVAADRDSTVKRDGEGRYVLKDLPARIIASGSLKKEGK